MPKDPRAYAAVKAMSDAFVSARVALVNVSGVDKVSLLRMACVNQAIELLERALKTYGK